MTDEQWLRETLGRSVPDPPTAPDRAGASRRRARAARRRGAAVVAGAAAVVLAGVLVPALVSGDDSPAPEPAPPAPTSTVPSPSVVCAAPPAPSTPTGELDAEASAEEVVAAYVGLLNEHDRDAASALVDGFGPQPRVPASYSRIDFDVERVRRIRFISSIWDATAVIGRYRVIPEDGTCVDYRRAIFMVGRDEARAFRIVSLSFAKDLPTLR
jgi:hypothetical protein